MKVKFIQKKFHFKNKIYKILKPLNLSEDIYSYLTNTGNFIISIDKFSSLEMGYYFKNLEKDEILYLNLKKNKIEKEGIYFKDIIILNHSLQFNIKLWKEIRDKFNSLNTEIIEKDLDTHLEEKDYTEYRKFYYRENKDFLDIKENYDSLFLIGSNKVFESISGDFYRLSNMIDYEISKNCSFYDEHIHMDIYLRKKINLDFMITYYNNDKVR